MDWIPSLVLIAVLVLQEVRHRDERGAWRAERQELLNRLMARDLPEYQRTVEDPKPNKPKVGVLNMLMGSARKGFKMREEASQEAGDKE